MMAASSLSLRQKIFLAFTFLYILFNAIPLFTAYLPITVQIICIVTVIACGLLYPRSLICKPMKWFYIFLMVLIAYAVSGNYFHINGLNNNTMPASSRIIIEAAWIMPSIMIADVLSEHGSMKLLKIVGWGSLILLVLSFIYILPVISMSANMLRELAMSDAPDVPKGLPDYTLMHSYPLMLPGLCLAFRKGNLRNSIFFAATIVLFSFVIMRTAVTTSIGISMAFIFFALLVSKESLNKTVFLLCLCIVLFYVAYESGLVLAFIEWVMPYFEGTAVMEKLIDIRNSINSGSVTGGTLEVRGDLHDLSKQSFYDNPLFGGDKVGRHSQVLDILGSMGIIGFLPFIMIFISVLKLYITEINDRFDRVFLYSCFGIALVYLYSKGIFGATGWLFTYVMAPCLVVAVANSNFSKRVRPTSRMYNQ